MLLNLRLKRNRTCVLTCLFNRVFSSSFQGKHQWLFTCFRARGDAQDLTFTCIQLVPRAAVVSKLVNLKIKLFNSCFSINSHKEAIAIFESRRCSINADLQCFFGCNNILGHANHGSSAVCSIGCLCACYIFGCISLDCAGLINTCISAKVDLCRDRPCIFAIDRISHISVGSCFGFTACNRGVSCKHRGRADGNRQRGCEEQGGRFLCQFHNPYSAMGPAADGQPWICLLLSHRMVC